MKTLLSIMALCCVCCCNAQTNFVSRVAPDYKAAAIRLQQENAILKKQIADSKTRTARMQPAVNRPMTAGYGNYYAPRYYDYSTVRRPVLLYHKNSVPMKLR